VNKGTVHRIRSHAIKDIEHDIGRPPILQLDEEANAMAYITDNFQRGSPVSPKQIRGYVIDAFGKQVRRHRHSGLSNVMRKRSNAPRHIPRRILAWKYQRRL
jgi:hypothetical protein